MMDPQVGQPLDVPSFCLCSICCPCSSFAEEHLWVKISKCMCGIIPLRRGVSGLFYFLLTLYFYPLLYLILPLISSLISLSPRSPLPLLPTIILLSPQCRTEAAMPWSPFLLRSIVSVGCIMDIVKFRANINLSVDTYHECSFVWVTSHRIFSISSICLQIV